jgi:hypothetical protein
VGQAQAAEKGLGSQAGIRTPLAALQVPLDQSPENWVNCSKSASIAASAIAASRGKNVQSVKLAPSGQGEGPSGRGASAVCGNLSRRPQGPLGASAAAAAALPPVPPHRAQEFTAMSLSVKSLAAGKHVVAEAGGPT